MDFVKSVTLDQIYIERLYDYANKNLVSHKPQNRNYVCYSNGSGRFRIEFRKIVLKGVLVGFRSAEICLSPHYLHNDDKHNGNDFTPQQCIKIIHSTFSELGFSNEEMDSLKVVNIEYGINIPMQRPIRNVIDGIFYTKKTRFKSIRYSTFKISDGSKFKRIKAYAKGVQFERFPEYGIDPDTFRFEFTSKESKKIRTLGINSLADLFKPSIHYKMMQTLLEEWDQVLIVSIELGTIKETMAYWQEIIEANFNRNRLGMERKKYYQELALTDNLHLEIKCKIIDKFRSFAEVQIPPPNVLESSIINY